MRRPCRSAKPLRLNRRRCSSSRAAAASWRRRAQFPQRPVGRRAVVRAVVDALRVVDFVVAFRLAFAACSRSSKTRLACFFAAMGAFFAIAAFSASMRAAASACAVRSAAACSALSTCAAAARLALDLGLDACFVASRRASARPPAAARPCGPRPADAGPRRLRGGPRCSARRPRAGTPRPSRARRPPAARRPSRSRGGPPGPASRRRVSEPTSCLMPLSTVSKMSTGGQSARRSPSS